MPPNVGLLDILSQEPLIRQIVRSEVAKLEASNKPRDFRLEWDEFSGGKGLFTISIKAPLKPNSSEPLLESTFGGVEVATPEEGTEPAMIFQIQFASDGAFTSDLETVDLGLTRTKEIKAESITRHAKARARFVSGGSWGEYFVSGSGAVSSGSAFDTTVDDLDDISDGSTSVKVNATAVTSGDVDLSKSGVVGTVAEAKIGAAAVALSKQKSDSLARMFTADAKRTNAEALESGGNVATDKVVEVSIKDQEIVQKKLKQVSIGSFNSTPQGSSSPLTATDAGSNATIDIAAFTMQYGFGTVSFNSGSVTSLAFSGKFFVFASDPTYAGGAVTYVASLIPDDSIDAEGLVLIGVVTTPANGAGDTSGGGGGGAGNDNTFL